MTDANLHTGTPLPLQKRSRREWAALVLAALAATAWLAWSHHQRLGLAEAVESQRLAANTRMLEINLVHQLRAAQVSLQGLRGDFSDGLLPLGYAQAQLRTLQRAWPGVRSLDWLDAQGVVLASSDAARRGLSLPGSAGLPLPPGGTASADDRLIVARTESTPDATASIEIAIRMPPPPGPGHGDARGSLIRVSLDPAFFSTLLASANYAPDMWSAISIISGRVLVFEPPNPRSEQTPLNQPGSLFAQHLASGQRQTVLKGPSLLLGRHQLVAQRTLGSPELPLDKSLVVATSRDLATVQAPVRAQTATYLALLACLGTLAAAGLLALQRGRAAAQASSQRQRAQAQSQAEFLALALRGGDLGLWETDLRTGEGQANDRWFDMLGLVRQAVEPGTDGWRSLVHPEDRERVVAARQAHIRGDTPSFEERYRLRHQAGHWVWVLDRARVVERDAEGQPLRMAGTHLDISEAVQREQALREREQQLSTITNAMPGPVLQVALDMSIRFVNASFERWRGVSASWAVGRLLPEVLAPEIMAGITPWMARVHAGETVQFTNRMLTEQGLRHALVVLVPDRDEAGQVCGHFAVLTDITERQLAEDALRLGESKSRALLLALRSGVVVHGPDTEVLDANPAACELLGLSLDQMRGFSALDPRWRFLEEDGSTMPRARFPAEQVRASGQRLRNLVLGIERPGAPQPTWVLCNGDLVCDAQGQLAEIIVTVLDITDRKQAAEALSRSQEQLRTASRIARLGSWRIDLVAGTLTASRELAQMLELPPDTPVPREQGLARIEPAERAHWEELMARCVANGAGFDDELALCLPSGRRLQMRALGEAVRDASGQVVALDGAMLDVTESRQAQQLLRLLQASIERLNDVVLITEAAPLAEPGPRIVFANAAFERVTGWRRSDVIGQSPRMLQGPATDRAELARIAQALQARQAVRSELVNYSPAGKPYWVEVEIVPVLGPDGAATHFVAVQRDISERKLAEISLQTMRDELSATLAAVPDLLFDIDLDGVFHSHHSPRRDLLAAAPEQFIGRRLDDFIPPEAAAVARAALAQAHAHGYSGGMQYELPLPDGARWFELSVSRKPVAEGALPRFIVLARDVTERKQGESERRALERQLREVQKMESIGTLAGGIAHDFNNILAAILGNVALARDDLPAEHEARSSLDQIQKASLRARTLVQKILTFSRRQPQQLTVQPLRPIVDETLALLRATLPAGVGLVTRLSEAPLPVRAEATQLQQVLMNLCTNAWQALPEEHGQIEVGLALAQSDDARDADDSTPLALRAGPCAHIWVRDNGTGIDPGLHDRIFDPFFTTKPVGQGTGLGLSVVHGIVRGHEGAITLHSTPGQGSTFHVWLPLAQAAAALPSQAGSAPRPGAGGGQPVLYVDDDEVMVVMVQRLLQRAGWQVSVCGSAAEALALVSQPDTGFAAVVSDFNMPGMSGMELARQLQAVAPAVPVIISSGYLSEEMHEQAREAGVCALMRKENSFEELAGLLARVTGRPGG